MRLKKSDLLAYLETDIFSLPNGGVRHDKMGLEIELIPFVKGGSCPKRASLDRVREALGPLFAQESWSQLKSHIFKKEGGAQVSFEPGGQIELSTAPYSSLSTLKSEIFQSLNSLESYLEEKGIFFCSAGADPWHSLSEIGLQLTDSRYKNMQRHFQSLEHSLGENMMLQTAAIQVCLDFGGDEETARKRYLLSQFLAPISSALFANSPFHEGHRSPFESFRCHIWAHLDQSRAGFPFQSSQIESFSWEECQHSYLEFALDSQLILYGVDSVSEARRPPLTFREWMGRDDIKPPTLEDFQVVLSLLFPEVRPKGFLELRSVDTQDFSWILMPAIFYAGLLYDPTSLEQAFSEAKVDLRSLQERKKKSRYGLKDPEIRKLAKSLMALALKGFENTILDSSSEELLEEASRFFELYTKRGLTPSSALNLSSFS